MSKPGFEHQWKSRSITNRADRRAFTGRHANGVRFVPMSSSARSNVYHSTTTPGTVWHLTWCPPAAVPGGITAAATRIVAVAPPPPRAAALEAEGVPAAGYRGAVGEDGEARQTCATAVPAAIAVRQRHGAGGTRRWRRTPPDPARAEAGLVQEGCASTDPRAGGAVRAHPVAPPRPRGRAAAKFRAPGGGGRFRSAGGGVGTKISTTVCSTC
jgi:hypothetical protein